MPHLIHIRNATIHGRVQKPVLNLGDKVYSAWWPDNNWKKPATWWPGIITNITVRCDVDHGYGPLRLYGVHFDDGDVQKNVEDVYVFPKEEYELTTSDEQNCMIRNVVDANSQDGWAQFVGWYEFSDGQGAIRSFSLLLDALDAYHQSVANETASNRSGSPENKACGEHINTNACGQRLNEVYVLSGNPVDNSIFDIATFWPTKNSKVFDSSIPPPSAILRELMEMEEKIDNCTKDLCINANGQEQTAPQEWSHDEKENDSVNNVNPLVKADRGRRSKVHMRLSTLQLNRM
jgi:hypothetical protein